MSAGGAGGARDAGERDAGERSAGRRDADARDAGREAAPAARLRGHHLVCLQFYRGEGYSAEFVANLERVIAAAAGERTLLVAGADDVCAACPSLLPDATCADTGAGEAEVRRLDELAWAVLGVAPGDRLSLADARERLAADAVAAGRWRAEACAGCAFEEVCEEGWDRLLDEAEHGGGGAES